MSAVSDFDLDATQPNNPRNAVRDDSGLHTQVAWHGHVEGSSYHMQDSLTAKTSLPRTDFGFTSTVDYGYSSQHVQNTSTGLLPPMSSLRNLPGYGGLHSVGTNQNCVREPGTSYMSFGYLGNEKLSNIPVPTDVPVRYGFPYAHESERFQPTVPTDFLCTLYEPKDSITELGTESFHDRSELLSSGTKPLLGNSLDGVVVSADWLGEGNDVEQHPVIPPCCGSRHGCVEKIPEERRGEIHRIFWCLRDGDERKRWIASHVCPSVHSARDSQDRKPESLLCYLPDHTNKLVRVCRTFFTRTLGYKWYDGLSALCEGEFPQSIQTERGSHRKCASSGYKLSKSILKSVQRHIRSCIRQKLGDSFVKCKKSWAHSKYDSIKKCFQLYTTDFPAHRIKYDQYRQIFLFLSKVGTIKPFCKSGMELSFLHEACFSDEENRGENRCYVDKASKYNSSSLFPEGPLTKQGGINAPCQAPEGILKPTAPELTNSVIMQLDSESDAIIITRNVSDSESDGEGSVHNGMSVVTPQLHKCDAGSSSGDMASNLQGTSLHHTQTSSTGDRISRYPMQAPCWCRRGCYKKLSQRQRSEIHHKFWKLSDYAKQKEWMLNHMYRRIYKRYGGPSRLTRKRDVRKYFLPNSEGSLVQVCSQYFLGTLGFSVVGSRVCLQNALGYQQHSSRVVGNKASALTSLCIKQHIQSFMKSEKTLSGLTQEASTSPSIALKEMYYNFLSSYPRLCVSYLTYSKFYHMQSNSNTASQCSSSLSEVCVENPSSVSDSEEWPQNYAQDKMDDITSQNASELASSRKRKLRTPSRHVSYSELPCGTPGGSGEYKPLEKFPAHIEKESEAKNADGFEDASISSIVSNIVSCHEEATKRQNVKVSDKPHTVSTNNDIVSELKLGDTGTYSQEGVDSGPEAGKFKRQKFRHAHKLNSDQSKARHPILQPCSCQRLRCIEKIPENQRAALHASFWELKSYMERKKWMLKYVQRWKPLKRKFTLIPARKHECRKYFLLDEQSQTVEVCRVFFLHTLGFKWARAIDEITMAFPRHRAGRHERKRPHRNRKIPELVIEAVKDFCESVEGNPKHELPSFEAFDEKMKETQDVDREPSEGMKIKKLFEEFKNKHTNIYLGYHNFQQILRDFVDSRLAPAKTVAVQEESKVEIVEKIPEKKKPRKPREKNKKKNRKKIPMIVVRSVREFWKSIQAKAEHLPPVEKRRRDSRSEESRIPGGRKIKELFVDYRKRQQNIQLGYHTFRRIIQNFLSSNCESDEIDELSEEEEIITPMTDRSKKTRRKLPEVVVNSVRKFWAEKSLKVEPSEEKKGKECVKEPVLPNGVNVKELFEEYKTKHTNVYIGYHNFRRILKNIFNPNSEPIETSDDKNSDIGQKPAQESVLKSKSKTSDSYTNYTTEVQVSNPYQLSHPPDKQQYPNTVPQPYDSVSGNTSSFMLMLDASNTMANTDLSTYPPCGRDGEDCILDVGSGLFKPKMSSCSTVNQDYNSGSSKYKRHRSLSVRNDKNNYPMLPPCNCAKRKCAERLSEARRQEIHDIFWSLAGYNERKQWMLENIKRTDIKRRVVFYDEGKPKKHESRWYYLPNSEGNPVEVCKAFFLRTLGYRWDSVIDTIGKTTPKGDMVATPDRRGRRPPAHKISEEAIISMTQYIESVCNSTRPIQLHKKPKRKRKKPNNMIPFGLTMKHLFEDYKSKHPNHKYGYESFRKVFRKVRANWIPTPTEETCNVEETGRMLTAGSESLGPDYSELDMEDPTDFQAPEMMQSTTPYPVSLGSYTSPQQPTAVQENIPERKSCLYQYSASPGDHPQHHHHPLLPAHHHPTHPTHHQASLCHDMHHLPHNPGPDHYRPLDNEQYMKYNLYGGPAMPTSSNHFPQPVDPLNYNNPGTRPDMDPSGSAGSQFPPYFMPNPEPFRRQVYHHMASQYQSILHHIAESNRIFNYSGLPPPPDGNFPMSQEKLAPFSNRPDYPRDMQNQNHFPPPAAAMKNPQGYVPNTLPLQGQYHDHSGLDHQHQESSNMDLASYSDENESNFLQGNLGREAELAPGFIDTLQVMGKGKGKKRGKSTTPRKKKGEKVKVKREKKLKPKSARNFGEHYPLLPPCNCKKKKCSEKFPESSRVRIHSQFWELKNYNERKQWMVGNIIRTDPKRRREMIGTFKKGESRWYFFQDEDGNSLEVCKTFFLHTLGYKWDSVIDTIRRTTPRGEIMSTPDQRGRKPPAHKLPNVVIRSVIQYIESMQQVSEPFNPTEKEVASKPKCDGLQTNVKKSTSNISIPYGLTMKDLFDDYKVKHAGHKIGYESFRRLYRAVAASEQMVMQEEKDDEEILNSHTF